MIVRWLKRGGVLVMLAMMLFVVACGDSQNSGKASDGNRAAGDGESGSGESGISFSYMMAGKYINWLNDLKWYPILLSRTGAQIELVNGGEDDSSYAQNLELKIGSGQFPDSGIVSLAQAEVYGTQGVFLDLKPYIDEHAPNIKKFLENNPDYANLVTTADGQIFGLPQEYPTLSYVTFYRKDMFEKAGIKDLPRTIEEFTDVLRTLKKTYTDPSFYPFTGRDHFLRYSEVFGANDHIDDSGKIQGVYRNGLGYNIYAPGFKEMLQWYRQLYEEKLIDPEWVAGTATEESWQTKMLTGKGAVGNDFFTRPSWFMNNGGPENDPDYSMGVMDPFLDKNGKQTMLPPYEPIYRMDRVFVINKKAESKAVGIIKFMDYVFSEEGMTLMNYGEEGVSYREEGGKKVYLVDFAVEGNQPLGTPVWNFLQDRLTFPRPVDNEAYYNWMDDLTKSFATTFFDKYTSMDFPSLKYSTEQLKERTGLLAKVQEEFNFATVKFVTGEWGFDRWDEFIAQMEKSGYKRIMEIDQAAYDAMKK